VHPGVREYGRVAGSPEEPTKEKQRGGVGAGKANQVKAFLLQYM